VYMQLTKAKVVVGVKRFISEELGVVLEESKRLLLLHGSVRNVLDSFK
jgi:N-acetylmuramic acid 6-phosphate etherase